ncbi:trypsin-like peptidase domain-containing protein [Paenibacillus arenilitoris]|uniref:Trypsin-like peptidase domain-containing protein n=1 Tax=Paenibacillus arenilitoris TaxID=2772299 RepID=A0A927CHP1_9BACL|nr:trypsin-like peptidase domain-containing protein [Paenibacillus arenilitoris]MBD2867705.1 trypsin-like peptidase domain-containing protein [Paenibacillus arenilitoris]
MKTKLIQSLLSPLLVAGLLLAPLPAPGGDSVSAAAGQAKAAAAAASQQPQVIVDGAKLTLAAPAYVEKGVTFVPARDIFKALGASFTWESKTQTIIGRKGNITISVTVGKKDGIVSGKPVKLEAAPVVKKGITFVPVRFVAGALQASLGLDSNTGAITITTRDAAAEEEYEDWLNEQQNKPVLTSGEIVDTYDESVVLIMTNRAQGSGVVIGDNLILTNHHVIADAASATVQTLYGDEAPVSGVVAYDAESDLAIIKTEEPLDLPAVEVTYALDSRKGDKVVAIGSPLGLQNTISDGLISNITFEGGVRYVQTSAPIDHGSSGGALFNEHGELIGITTLGYSGSNADLNFAVSVFHAAVLVDEMTEEMVENAKFLPSKLPSTLAGAPLADIQKVMADQFASLSTTEGVAAFTKWEAKRDAAGWLVLTADIDPLFYMYYGPATAQELRMWAINMGYDLHDMLPDDKIQVVVSYERDFGFEPRGFEPGQVTSLGGGKWRVRYPVIDMQLKDQLHIEVRD